MIGFLRTFGWLASIVYATIPCFWLAIHPFAGFWRARRRSPYRILVPAWIALWIAVGLATAPYRRILLYDTPWTWLTAAALILFGIRLYRISGRSFSLKLLSGLPEIAGRREPQKLMVNGIRARVRHPIYAAHLCELAAWSLGTGLAVVWGLFAFGLLSGAVMIWLEERELVARFGDDYRAYQRRVPMLIPHPGGPPR